MPGWTVSAILLMAGPTLGAQGTTPKIGRRRVLAQGIPHLVGRHRAVRTGSDPRMGDVAVAVNPADQRYQHSTFAGLPQWDGKPLPKGRLLVYGEQGLGDEIMFASMFNQLSGNRVMVMCDPRVGALGSVGRRQTAASHG